MKYIGFLLGVLFTAPSFAYLDCVRDVNMVWTGLSGNSIGTRLYVTHGDSYGNSFMRLETPEDKLRAQEIMQNIEQAKERGEPLVFRYVETRTTAPVTCQSVKPYEFESVRLQSETLAHVQ